MSNYSERQGDIAILQLKTEGFDQLTEKQKNLVYFLAQAGLWGRTIALDQGSKHNVSFMQAMIALYKKTEEADLLHTQLHDSLFKLFTHNGIYHNMSGERLSLPLELSVLETYSDLAPELVNAIKNIWFYSEIPQFRTVQKEDVDVVKGSGCNFYDGLTTEDVLSFRATQYPSLSSDEVPQFGFNERLVKNENGSIERQTISAKGLHGYYVEKIIENLTSALSYTENQNQHDSIKTLIEFYKSGDAFDFDKHSIAWTKDADSNVYFINGLIESYDDPLGTCCTFESIVAFKNPLQTAKVNKIIENIQWFEQNLPVSSLFKKEKAVGLSASSITVVSMAGDTSPILPLGVNLPNNDWIRRVHGSKSVSLENVSSAGANSVYAVPFRKAFHLPKYHACLEKYGSMTNCLHTDLHEITGHGSGQLLEGVSTDVLGAFHSVIEEARADLVALYYLPDEKLKSIGVYDQDVDVGEAALAQYVSYLTNGAFGQLRRVELGNELTQAHFRNRQLIARWVLAHSSPDKVQILTENGNSYIEVNDVEYVKDRFGRLLARVQEIKSTGDFEGAKDLVMIYGVSVDRKLHEEVLSRMEQLDMPKVTGFITPMLKKVDEQIVIEQADDFFVHQLMLHEMYC